MAAAGGFARSRERVERICDSAADDRTLRILLIEEIRRAVGFDAYAWLLTDPETAVGTAPLADVPCLPELHRLIRLRYGTALNRWTQLTPAPVATLHEATAGDLSRSMLWRELLAAYGVIDLASTVFNDSFGWWGFLDLWRCEGAATFGADEVAYLAAIAGPVTSAIRRSLASTFVASATASPSPGPAVLLLAPDLTVRAQTPETEQVLRVLLPPAPTARRSRRAPTTSLPSSWRTSRASTSTRPGHGSTSRMVDGSRCARGVSQTWTIVGSATSR